mmetsp:Transcript_25110/g.72476  ORF Transcript_25110/g.72476 Transcript_25110/m.72476 type:complete len:80 (+) Transcript_25110:100-339(+)
MHGGERERGKDGGGSPEPPPLSQAMKDLYYDLLSGKGAQSKSRTPAEIDHAEKFQEELQEEYQRQLQRERDHKLKEEKK